MSFDNLESSQDAGGPTQLYLFRYGDEATEYFAYTDHTQTVTVAHGAPLGTIDYIPVPCQRDEIVANGTLDRSAIGLRLDVSTDLAELFRVYPPSYVVTLTIFQGHIDDPDDEFLAVWTGRLVSASREQSQLVLSGEPISTQMRRPGLRRNYQYGCPLWLYGPDCRANEAAATTTGTVDSLVGNVVTLNAGWNGAFNADKFVRGMLQWTPPGASVRRRMIVRRAGNVLTLSGVPTDLDPADAVEVVLGCNHQAFTSNGGDCQQLHNNLVNYGGQPWIPLKNIINSNPFY